MNSSPSFSSSSASASAPSHTTRSDPLRRHDTEELLNNLADHPEFKKLVRHQANVHIRKAIKEGLLRPGRVVSQFMPRMDILDDESISMVTATFEIPGVRPKDIKIEVADGVLTVSGQRSLHLQRTPGVQACIALWRQSSTGSPPGTPPRQTTENHRVRLASELRYGSFSRTVFLPRGIEKSHISARLDQGMLAVTWPRAAPSSDESKLATPTGPNASGAIAYMDDHSTSIPVEAAVEKEGSEC